jgi:hypothetical protein
MLDVFYIGVVAVFFLLSAWLIGGMRRLQKEGEDE